MNNFGETVRRFRIEKGRSTQQLADHLHVSRPTVANWEVSRRIPDATMVALIADALGVDTGALLATAEVPDEPPNVLLVDDKPIILEGGIPILRQALPGANVVGFLSWLEALDYIREKPVALAFLDIELGKANGLDLCREMLSIRPRTNVIYLTNFIEYAFDAWDTGACGFLLKPLEVEEVRRQLLRLRYPVRGWR
ncbi:MAG: response regulator [Clostridia bacterium]|nr:response regulator [Clostridia bacterium]